MTLLSAQRRLSSAAPRSAAHACAAVVFALLGWLVAGMPDTGFVPATAVLALVAAGGLVLIGIRTRTLLSPLILLCVPLLLSLSAAMGPITRIFGDWSTETLTVVILIVLAPLAGITAAMVLSPGRTPDLERGTLAIPYEQRLVVVCLLMCAIGTGVYLFEWSGVGGPPLLSANIDKSRFALDVGPLHVFTEGVPLSLLIATWARAGRPGNFTASQRRVLEAIMCFVPVVLALSGGRSLVLMPLLAAVVVAARYVSPQAARRLAIVIPVAILIFSSAVFLLRLGQDNPTGAVGTVLYSDTGAKSSPLESVYRSLSINLGEQLRVVSELSDANIHTPPFTSSMWFAHNVTSRATNPQTIVGANTGGWLTSMYAGPLLLDFGLLAALAFGFVLGAAAYLLYRRFARGRSVAVIWLYAYLAGPITLSFYLNVFLYFIFPVLDVIALLVLSRLLIRPSATA